MKNRLFLLIAVLCSINAVAQDFPYGNTSMEDLQVTRYDKDTSAHAVVLNEYGTSRIDINVDQKTVLIFDYHVRIKIFDSKAFDIGTFDAKLRRKGAVHEEIDNIAALTTYIDDGGSVKKSTLDPKDIFKLKGDGYISEVKFAVPGLRKGCVIEFKYTLTTPFFIDYKPWLFQSSIPKRISEYETHIPGYWDFNVIYRGPVMPIKQTTEIEKRCFIAPRGNAYADCTHRTYTLTDIPAFTAEEYMTAPKNFEIALYYELSSVTNPYSGVTNKFTEDWSDVDNELKDSELFGRQLKKTSMLKKRIAPVIEGKTNDMDKAKAIYDYVRRNIKWNNRETWGSLQGIEDALDKHSGDVGDINLTLVTALNAAGIHTEPVLLSTRNNGLLNKFYPTLEEFDYVIAMATIGDQNYFADASENYMGFGMLPLKCLNGDGRVLSQDEPSYWVPVKPNEKKMSTYNLDLTLQPDGKITGTMIHYALGYQAYELRRGIKKFNSIDEYVESLDKKLKKIKIIKADVANLDSLDLPVTETYQVELAATKKMDAAELSFNPVLLEKITNNPFKLAERSYPVDMGMPSERRFTLSMHLPEGYEVVTPSPINITMPDNGGRFQTIFETSANTVTFSDIIALNKSIYTPEEYPSLKEFYNKIIVTEKSNLVFKKKL
jgi:Transglutaminase-like superfamily